MTAARARIGVLFALVVLGGCAATGATGDETLDVLRATRVLAAQVPRAVPFVSFVDGMAESSDPGERGVFRTLVRAGILRAYTAASVLQSTPQAHYRLTASGWRLAGGWLKAEHGGYNIPVGRLKLVAVNGVEMLSPRHAMVSYTYRIEVGALGRLLMRSREGPLMYFDPLKSMSRDIRSARESAADAAELTRFDDGWKTQNSVL